MVKETVLCRLLVRSPFHWDRLDHSFLPRRTVSFKEAKVFEKVIMCAIAVLNEFFLKSRVTFEIASCVVLYRWSHLLIWVVGRVSFKALIIVLQEHLPGQDSILSVISIRTRFNHLACPMFYSQDYISEPRTGLELLKDPTQGYFAVVPWII